MGKFANKIKAKKDEMLLKFAFSPIGRKMYFSDCDSEEEFYPSTYSLLLVCKHVNREASFYDIRSAIYKEAARKEKYSYRIDVENPWDIHLDEEAILDYKDVLVGFFGKTYIDELYTYIKYTNEMRRELYEYKGEIKNYSNETLKKILANLERYPEIKGVKVNEYHKEMIDIYRKELEYRRKNNVIISGASFDPEIHHCKHCMIPKAEWKKFLLSYDGDECKLLRDFWGEIVFFEVDSVIEKFIADHPDIKNPSKTLLELLNIAFDLGMLRGKQYEALIDHIEELFKGGVA